jgi:hypothetical protein
MCDNIIMVTITQLFKMVSANDYNGLNQLLLDNNSVNINSYKSGQSLISKAIEFRAKECFDILIDNPSNTILKSKNSNLNGLDKALEYFGLAPNTSNEYYVKRLLEKNVEVDPYIVYKVMNNSYIFQELLNRIPNDLNNFTPILYESIRLNNIEVFNMLYQKIFAFNLDQITYKSIQKQIINNAIYVSNFNVIDIVKTNIDWKKYTYGSSNNKYNILYHIIFINNKIMFEYFYKIYEKLSEEYLNQIPYIKDISVIFIYLKIYNNKTFNFIKESLKKIYKLPIKFNDGSESISKMFKLIINYNFTIYTYSNYKIKIDIIFKLMYWFLSNNKVNNNPLDLILFSTDIKNIIANNITKLNANSNFLNNYKNLFKKFLYLMEHFNFNITKQNKDNFEAYYQTDNESNWDIDKKAFISQLIKTKN